jgi:hypothetical protein
MPVYANAKVDTCEAKEDERDDLEDQTSEHEVVSQFHGGLFRGRGGDAPTASLERERDDIAGYEETCVPDWLDSRDSLSIRNDSKLLLACFW